MINPSEITLPRLLDANFGEVRSLYPASLSLDLKLSALSTADMQIYRENIPVRSWCRLYTVHGPAGIFRASSVETDYGTDTQRIAWEHGISALGDALYPEPEEGDEDELTGTVRHVLTELLSHQTAKNGSGAVLWALGTCASTDTVTLTPGRTNLYDLLLTVMGQIPDYRLEFDQSSFPWVLNIVAQPVQITAEGRLSRNLGSVRIAYDDSDLCTRVISSALPRGRLDSQNISVYGVVEQSLTLPEDTDEALAIASRFLEIRETPRVGIEIDAIDLYRATGEERDSYTLGERFLLALPDYDTALTEIVVALHYGDVYGDPRHVTVSLHNEISDLTARFKQIGQQEKQARNTQHSLYNTQKAVYSNQTRLAVHDKYMTTLEDEGIVVWREASSSVEVGPGYAAMKSLVYDEPTGEYKDKTDFVSAMRAAGITVDATKSLVDIMASTEVTTHQGVETNAAAIEVQAGQISSKVSTTDYNGNTIASLINQTATTILLKASKINLEGYVTMSTYSADLANIQNMLTGSATISQLRCTDFWLSGHQFYLANGYVRYGAGD